MREVTRVKRKKRNMHKGSSGFKFFMLAYAGMWLVLTFVLCAVLWTNLSRYQSNYDAAKEAGRPELAMDEAMAMFGSENIKALAETMEFEITSRFETMDDYVQFYYDFLEGRQLEYAKDEERYNDARPVYDVYADDVLFAVVSLKAAGEKDAYGFNKWEVREVVLSENNYEYHDVYLKVMDGMTVYINGIAVDEREYIRGGVIENELTDKAYELTGVSYGYKVYYAGDMISEPDIQVVDASGRDVTNDYIMEDNGLRNYETTASEQFVTEVQDRVTDFCETYVYHIYRKASVDDVAGMMEDGSEAERLLYNAQSTLAWAWVPDTVEILDESYDNYVYYNDEYFSCRSTIHIRKSDESTAEEEEFVCRWLFKKIEGQWLVTYFLLG